MANTAALMKPGASQDWETPPALFAALAAEFDFTLDVCASASNAKVSRYYDEAMDGLQQDWAESDTGVCWLNPPYNNAAAWIAKAESERRRGVTTVALIPARTDTRMWHRYLWDATTHHPRTGIEVRFLPGRVHFWLDGKPAPAGSTFPSAIIVFRGE